jgi:hypothetical protein
MQGWLAAIAGAMPPRRPRPGRREVLAAYTFGVGDPSVLRTYWFQVASLPMGNYPWAPAASGKQFVTVGGHG